MNNQHKQILIWISVIILMVITFNALQGDGFSGKSESLAFSDFLSKVDARQVNSVKIQGRYIEGLLSDGTHFPPIQLIILI